MVLDESALIEDDLYRALRPMLAVSQGKVFAIGTPHGRRGWFAHSWCESDEFHKVKVTASQCPRISKEFLAQERRTLGEWWYKQEFECEFTESSDHLFSWSLIERAFTEDFEPIKIDWDSDDDEVLPGSTEDFDALNLEEVK